MRGQVRALKTLAVFALLIPLLLDVNSSAATGISPTQGGFSDQLAERRLAVAESELAEAPIRGDFEVPIELLRDYESLWPGIAEDQVRIGLSTYIRRLRFTRALAPEPSFAGQWFDYPNGIWHVAATDAALLDWVRTRARQNGVETETDLVAYPAWTLMAVGREWQRRLDQESRVQFNVEPDPRRNRVVVTFAEAPGSSELMKDLLADDVVDVRFVQQLPVWVEASCTTRWSCSGPLGGGINVSYDPAPAYNDPECTLGYTATKAATGQRYVLTAGHCNKDRVIGEVWYHDTHSIGDSRRDVQVADADFLAIGITSSYWLGFSKGWLQTSLATDSAVDGQIAWMPEIALGDTVCQLGRYFGAGVDNCGVVSAENWSGKPQVRGVRTCGGDSGGSVYMYTPASQTRIARWSDLGFQRAIGHASLHG
jgi:hypothetical protein